VAEGPGLEAGAVLVQCGQKLRPWVAEHAVAGRRGTLSFLFHMCEYVAIHGPSVGPEMEGPVVACTVGRKLGAIVAGSSDGMNAKVGSRPSQSLVMMTVSAYVALGDWRTEIGS
jgi:hypothetical protein